MKSFRLPQTFLIMSFRYALDRNTSAPWEVCQYIKKYWKHIDPEFKRQIVEDIKREARFKADAKHWTNQLSDDWVELLGWIEMNE